MKIPGRQLVCDRCGATEFKRYTGKREDMLDRAPDCDFEPDDWKLIPSPNANTHILVCPDCHKRYLKVLDVYFSGTLQNDQRLPKERFE